MGDLLVSGIGTAGEDDFAAIAPRAETWLLGDVDAAPLDVLIEDRTLVGRWKIRVAVAEEANAAARGIDERLDVPQLDDAGGDALGSRQPSLSVVTPQLLNGIMEPEPQ